MSKILDTKKREQAFLLYGKYRNIQTVSEETGLDISTLSRWKREDNWDSKLVDVSKRMKGMLNVLERAKQDLVIADMVSELSLLELLETFVAQAIAIDGVRPSKWADVLSTMKFIAERKDTIFSKAESVKRETESTPIAEESKELSDEERLKLESLKSILQTSSTSVSLDSLEYTPVTPEEAKKE